MSSYWKAYHGVGLILTPDEFENFLKKYATITKTSIAVLEQKIEDDGVNEIKFKRSNDSTDKPFYITEVNSDYCSVCTLFPFIHENKANGHPDWYEICYESCYILYSDHDFTTLRCFDEKPYKSYDEFVNEFKGKLESYLPSDFNWDEHLGDISYAVYA